MTSTSTKSSVNFPAIIGEIATILLGEPNPEMSRAHDLRFGAKGSLSVNTSKAVWQNFEAGTGGGTLDLIRAHTDAQTDADCFLWLEQQGLIGGAVAPTPTPLPENSKATDPVVAWDRLKPLSEIHPYLAKKGVGCYGDLRTDRQGNLCVPCFDGIGEALKGYQRIPAKGVKKFAPGTPARLGLLFPIGDPATNPDDPLILSEGYATGGTLHIMTGWPVIVAFGAGWIFKVASKLRERYPDREIILGADADPAGRKAADAVKALGIHALFPESGDWNDVWLADSEKAQRDFHLQRNNVLATLTTLTTPNHEKENSNTKKSDGYKKTGGVVSGLEGERLTTLTTPGALITTLEDSKGEVKHTLKVPSEAAIIVGKTLDGQFAFDPEPGLWHLYTGSHWEPLINPSPLMQSVSRWMIAATAPRGYSVRYMDGVLQLVERMNLLPVPEHNPSVIPFQNGLLNLTTRQLEPVTPNTAQTWSLPYCHDPKATCPSIILWLRFVAGDDPEVVQLLRAFLAAILRGASYLQKFLHLVGPGGTGKSTFLRLAATMVGTANTVSTSLRELEQNRFESAMLYRKRLTLITDSDRYGGSLNVLKALTGGDPVRLERKHTQQAGSFIYDGGLVIASNEPIVSKDYTSGLERRRITVVMARHVTDEQKQAWRDQGGEEAVLHREMPGLISWLLDMPERDMVSLIENPPAAVRNANLDAMQANNPVADWMLERCIFNPSKWTALGSRRELKRDGETKYQNSDFELYPNYLAWCAEEGRSGALSARRFKTVAIDVARTLGITLTESRRSVGRGVTGICLKNFSGDVFGVENEGPGVVSGVASVVTEGEQHGKNPEKSNAGVVSVASVDNSNFYFHTKNPDQWEAF